MLSQMIYIIDGITDKRKEEAGVETYLVLQRDQITMVIPPLANYKGVLFLVSLGPRITCGQTVFNSITLL